MRIERYLEIIAGADFLKFENLEEEDFKEAEEQVKVLESSSTQTIVGLDKLLSLAGNSGEQI